MTARSTPDAPSPPHRVLVAMSGGVDSSVAAALLVEEGFDVVGVTMKTFCYTRNEAPSRTCCGLDGIRDARAVARQLGIEHHIFDLEEEFTRDVVDDFVEEYARGRTPNPCVRCNSNTKFRDLLRRGGSLGCDWLASGHYARVRRGPEGTQLLAGTDAAKDQSYFLWGLPAEVLERLVLPLGDRTKEEVRGRARALGLPTAEKPESQEICFVPDGDYRGFLGERLPRAHPALVPGPIEDSSGTVVGEHEGYAGFTVGQRKGLGGGSPTPLFVLRIRPEDRAVVVGKREELDADGVAVEDAHWLGGEPPGRLGRVRVRIRHRAPLVEGVLEEATGGAFRVRFSSPQRAVSPGQSAVIYRGDTVLGGGRIASSLSS